MTSSVRRPGFDWDILPHSQCGSLVSVVVGAALMIARVLGLVVVVAVVVDVAVVIVVVPVLLV